MIFVEFYGFPMWNMKAKILIRQATDKYLSSTNTCLILYPGLWDPEEILESQGWSQCHMQAEVVEKQEL